MSKKETGPKWRQIKCSGGPLPYMSVKWEVRDGETVPIPDETGGRIVGHYHLRNGTYWWEPA